MSHASFSKHIIFYHTFCLQSTALINLKVINFKNSVVAVSQPEETEIRCLANVFIALYLRDDIH